MPMCVYLVGTYDEQGRPDASLIDRAGTAGSFGLTQGFVYISTRPDSQTKKNILAKKAFTLNIPSVDLLDAVDFCGTVSAASGDRYIDKFAAAGLTPTRGKYVDAPMVEECPVSMECQVLKMKTFGEGSFTMFIASVKSVWIEKSVLNGPGSRNPKFPDPRKIKQIVYYPGAGEGSGYYVLGKWLGNPEEVYTRKFPSGLR